MLPEGEPEGAAGDVCAPRGADESGNCCAGVGSLGIGAAAEALAVAGALPLAAGSGSGFSDRLLR
jgi:hypothetical protein